MVALLLACAGDKGGDERLHAEALRSEPVEAAALCGRIRQPALRADCAWATVAGLAPVDRGAAEALCQTLEGSAAEECWFVLAETVEDAAPCSRAGSLELDCRMHRLASAITGRFPRGVPVGSEEQAAEELILGVGLELDDDRPWSAWYRTQHGFSRPLDRGACAALQHPMRREVCEGAAVGLLHDRLNFGRDQGLSVCEGELPAALAYAPDPVLDAVLAERRAADLCDPTARHAPPPGGLR